MHSAPKRNSCWDGLMRKDDPVHIHFPYMIRSCFPHPRFYGVCGGLQAPPQSSQSDIAGCGARVTTSHDIPDWNTKEKS